MCNVHCKQRGGPRERQGLQNTFVCSLEKMTCMHIRNNGTEKVC
jgi:hypothetical protein